MESGLCKFRHIFGKEGQGFHEQRFMGIALYDTLGTIGGAWIISKVFKIDFVPTLIGAFIVGIVVHRLFCVNTTINQLIFGKVA